MGRKETVELTNMCMVEDGKGNVLVQNRLDPNWSGIVYPGGHVEAGESITASVIREIREETGLTIENPTLCGVKQIYGRAARLRRRRCVLAAAGRAFRAPDGGKL